MASIPSFVGTPKIGSGTCTVADATRSGSPATVSTIFTAGASGSRIDRIDIMESGASGHAPSNNTVSLWIYDGVTYRLFREVALSAAPTPAAGTAGFQTSLTFPYGLILPSGYSVRASIRASSSDSINILAYGGDI